MKPSRVKHDKPVTAQVVVADRIDEQIIERKETSQSKKGKPCIVQNIKYRNLLRLSHVDSPLFSR
jgi:6,7-dimethyl-8-ribityllumazine synthase